ncbi:MAG: nuclear transport factor 2 family protein [Ilumatobacteraceae bacterium]
MNAESDFGPLERTVAREQIRDLVARYNANGDTGRFAQVRALFADDAVMRIEPDQEFAGIEAIMTIFTGATSDTASSNLTHVRHFTSTHQIDFDDASHATGRLYFAVLTDVGLDHWGRYVDRYVRSANGWLFAHRSVSVDGWAQNSLFPRL